MTTAGVRGRFIVMEGIEGAGKSTQAERLGAWLCARGIDHVATREPGGAPFAERLREALLAPSTEPVAPLAELLAMFAARADHLESTIEPALHAGRWVLCDRFTDASYAYQGAGRGLGPAAVATLEDLVQGQLRPDCVMLIDVPVEVGLGRSAKRVGAADRIELESLAFFRRVRAAYLARAAAAPRRYCVVNGSASVDDVHDALCRCLAPHVDAWRASTGAATLPPG